MPITVQVDGIAFTVSADANGCLAQATCASYPKTGQPLTVPIIPPLDPMSDPDTVANAIEDQIPLNLDNADVAAISASEGGSMDPNEGAIRQSYGGG